MKIAIVGSGKVATYLGRAFRSAGNKITAVYSRNPKRGRLLAKKLGAVYHDELTDVCKGADICLIAVTDDATAGLVKQIRFGKALPLHVSGSLPIDVIKQKGKQAGVLWPMFSFTSLNMPLRKDIPVFVEGTSPLVLKKIEKLAKSISKTVVRTDSATRFLIHLSAVFANNFANHMYVIADRLLAHAGLDFGLFVPMLFQNAERLKSESPFDMQTGPAKRGDLLTLRKQLNYLDRNRDWQKIYKQVSRSIIAEEESRDSILHKALPSGTK